MQCMRYSSCLRLFSANFLNYLTLILQNCALVSSVSLFNPRSLISIILREALSLNLRIEGELYVVHGFLFDGSLCCYIYSTRGVRRNHQLFPRDAGIRVISSHRQEGFEETL